MHMFFSKRLTKEAAFLIGLSVVFFVLRFPSLYEPYWYGDEGIYFTIGRALRAGRDLYTGIWDNKPPLLYWFYTLFNDLFSIRLVSLLFGIAAVVAFYLLAREFFHKKVTVYLTTILFALLFALPSFEGNIANAENFMLFPIMLGILLFWRHTRKLESPRSFSLFNRQVSPLFVAGVAMGTAFLFKIVAVFDFAACVFFLFSISMLRTHGSKVLHYLQRSFLPLLVGFMSPFLLVSVFFLIQGTLPEFYQTIFLRNVSYVGENNVFLFPQGLLVIKVLLLSSGVVLLFLSRNHLTERSLFILSWLAFSLFNAFFSQRPYIHYQLVLLPSISLLIGMIPTVSSQKRKLTLLAITGVVLYTIYSMFPHWNGRKTVQYYRNFLSFVSGKSSVTSYQTFFDGNTPRDYAVADYLSLHVKENDSVFLWGNSAQIYYLSRTVPAGRYSVAYHIVSPDAVDELRKVFATSPPKYVVILPETETFPLIIPKYTLKATIGNADVYEKNY